MRLMNALFGLCLILLASSTTTLNAQCSPDTDAPVISNMPANITGTADAGLCNTNITWTLPSATDDCELSSFTADAAPGELFAVGITVVTYTAMDEAGNMAAASFTVTITDDEDPVIAGMPSDIMLSNDADDCTAVHTWTAPTATDNCGIASITSDYNSGHPFPVGTTTVTYTVTDVNGRAVTASFDVTVTDDQDPSISGTPSDINQTADSGDCEAVVTWTAPTADDNCSATLSSTHNPGDSFNVGTTTVTYTATDAAGNSVQTSFDVTVTDDEAPSIAQMAGISQTNDLDACGAVVTWADPAVTDNCGNNTLASDIASGSSFDVGVTEVTYTATDIHGNQSTMSFNVTVTDGQLPVIADMPADISQGTDAGSCSAVVTWDAPSATDNCTLQTLGSDINSGATFQEGTTTVTYTAIDIYGNTTTATFDVTITSTDSDGDGICDNGDNCSDQMACNYSDAGNADCLYTDVCGVCGGSGIPAGDCDCNGNQLDALGDCGGSCTADADMDGICDDVDPCVGAFDACGECNGPGEIYDCGCAPIPPGNCDCNGNTTDALGVCGGTCPADTDGDGLCDDSDNCTDTMACNYDDPANGACATVDECGVCGGSGIAPGDCDCAGNTNDALGVCGGSCAADADMDGVCDDVDPCVGTVDACGVCNGPGATYTCGCSDIPAGDCDCNGNQLDALNVCGGTCAADTDNDGICDDVDPCVGALDVCGECNGPGAIYDCGCSDIPEGECDCNGNIEDALGVCGGGCVADNDNDGICDDVDDCVGAYDECGVCNGPGATSECGCGDIPQGDCDCNGNQLDAIGVCGGDCGSDADSDGVCDDIDPCIGAYDACGVCNGPGSIYACGCEEIPAGDCDCNGNQLDALNVCGGTCAADSDADGVCDDADNCTDTMACNYDDAGNSACQYTDECGVCGGSGIAPGACDCAGNVEDALGVCGGTCAADADADGVCDDADNCTDTMACNYDDAGNTACQYLDALGVCGGPCAADIDGDGLCDDTDNCTDNLACNYDDPANDACATIDECGECGGSGIAPGECDCDGNVNDALGVCGGSCAADADMDGVCDDIDPCVGTIDACGVCNGPGSIYACGCEEIPAGDCDCNGNQLDALNVCGGTCAADSDADGVCDDADNCTDTMACNYDDAGNTACQYTDECGVCGGSGIAPGACDCAGNVEDALGVCGGTCAADSDSDGICDDSDGCTDLTACNYADASNAACIFPAGCETCTNADGTGGVDANDDDGDGTCNDADGCPNDPAKTAPGICGCGNVDTDVDNDGVCDDNDLCTDPLANNYQSPLGEECAPCPDAPIFNSILPVTPATTLSSTDGSISLDVTGGTATTLILLGINGAPDYSISLPASLDNLQAGYYQAHVLDDQGCIGVAQTSPGGSTLQQPGVYRELIIPFSLCCSGCGINDSDADGICDDDDNCTDQTAPNFADPANTECIQP